MPLLLTQNDLRPLLEESVQEGLQVIREAGTMIRAFPTVGHRTTADASLVLLFDDRTPAGLTGRG